jgi:hypothetical protein
VAGEPPSSTPSSADRSYFCAGRTPAFIIICTKVGLAPNIVTRCSAASCHSRSTSGANGLPS